MESTRMLAKLHVVIVCLLVCRSNGLFDAVNHIESARLYGNIDSYAYWFVDLLVGTPAQRVSVILDTGSGLAAFPCASCPHCGHHIDPNFDIAKSTTAKWVGCGKDCHGSCSKGHCSYHQGYQEGSSINGYWFSDYVRLGDAIQRNPAVHVRMGCHQNENKLFYTQQANGILGIRGSGTLLRSLFQDKPHVNTNTFSMCLAEWGGRLVVGGFNASYHTGKPVWIPLNTASYQVTLSTMKVGSGGAAISNFGHTMVDSGTTYTYMGSKPYKALRRGIEGYCRDHDGCGGARLQGSSNCWKIPALKEGLKKFPTVEVYFGKTLTTWEPRGYLYRRGTGDSWCYSFEDDGPNAGTVLGASWMLYHEVIFNLEKSVLGIVPANCPEYQKRPKHRTDNLDLPIPGAAVDTSAPPAGSSVPVGTTTEPVEHGHGGSGAGTKSVIDEKAVAEIKKELEKLNAADPKLKAPSYAKTKARRSFLTFAKVAVIAVVAALLFGCMVYCACKHCGDDDEPPQPEATKTPKGSSDTAGAQAIGAAVDTGNDEENQSLVERSASQQHAAPDSGSDEGRESF